MTAAEQVLLRLDALEVLGLGTRAPSPAARARVEPVVAGHGAASFGSLLGQPTVADLQDIVASWGYRMKQLGDSYAKLAALWKLSDPAAFADWTNDWNALQARYNAALARAQTAISVAKLNVFTPNSAIVATSEYDGLSKAMRQCYPPDGCPTSKGDFDDLNNRFTAAAHGLGGQLPSYANIPQPQATDIDQRVFAVTAPIDVVAQVTGEEKPKLPGLGEAARVWAWIVKHQKGLIIGGGVAVGGILLLELLPVIALPFKAAKGVAALAAV